MRNTSVFAVLSTRLICAVSCSILLAAQPVLAQALININFTDTPYSGTNETSPATPAGPAGTWNNLASAAEYETDTAAVVLADGNPGPTLTFDAASGSGGTWTGTALGFLSPPVDYTTGVYDVANLYETGLRNNGNNTTGFRIKGLAPGNYEVFLVPIFRNTQAEGAKADPAVVFSIGLGNDSDARNVGDYTLTSTAASPTQNIDTRLTSWTAATDGSTPYNYVGVNVTIDSVNRWLNFLMPDSSTVGPDRPGPSVIQLRLLSSTPGTAGDFNGDGNVDAADYTVWRDSLGSETNLPNSGELTAPVGEGHYNLWKTNFGNGFGSAAAASVSSVPVPEPSALWIALVVGVSLVGGGRLRHRE